MYYQDGDTTTAKTKATIAAMCGSIYSEYLYTAKYPGVVGIMSANKLVKGKYQGIPSLTFLVEKKIPTNILPPDKALPSTINNIATDVIETGKITAHSLKYFNNNYTNSYRNSFTYKPLAIPVNGGAKIQAIDAKNTGTLSCAVEDKDNIYILSSNHVLSADNKLITNNPVYKLYKGSSNTNSDFIGTLIKSINISFASKQFSVPPENRIDAALAFVGKKSFRNTIIKNVVQPGVTGLEKFIGISPASLEDLVYKSGAISGINSGTVWGVNATVIVDYGESGTALFTNQTVTSNMSKSGDSGSIGWKKDNKLFGLLVAGSNDPASANSISVYSPIDEVLSTLNVTPMI